MSTAIPIVFAPYCIDGKCYLDGGISTNYPLNYCIDAGNKKEEILGFKNKYIEDVEQDKLTYMIDQESSMLDYIMSFIHRLIFNMNTESQQQTIPNEVIYEAQYLSFEYLQSVLSSQDIRTELKNNGINAGESFLNSQHTDNKE